MAVFSSLYPSILYFVKTVHECKNINQIPAKLDTPSYIVSDFLEVERAIAREDVSALPSKKFMNNYKNCWILLLTTECYDLLSPTSRSNNAIKSIIQNYDCTRVFFVTQHHMQTEYVSEHFPSLNILGSFNEWEVFSYIHNKNWTIKDTVHYKKRFAFINRRNDRHRSTLFYYLWNIDQFPENTFASFNPGNYWDTMGLAEDDVPAAIQLSWKSVLDNIKNQEIVSWLNNAKFPQLPIQYSSQDPVNYHWEGNTGLCDLMHDTGISIVAETVTYPSGQQLFTTEKIFRPILAGQPFITLASQGYLRNLRSLGYRTFSDIWDESYDDLEHVTARSLAIRDLVSNLNSMSETEFTNVLERCREVCAHNREIMQNRTRQEFVITNIGDQFKSQLNRNPYKYKKTIASNMIEYTGRPEPLKAVR